MGSGRGKSRRVLVHCSYLDYDELADEGVKVHVDKWFAFLESQGIGNVKLADYYGVELSDTTWGPIDDAPLLTGLATEFFQDLAGTGAIELPTGVRADDFEFDVRMVEPHPSAKEKILMLMVKHRGTQREVQCSRIPHYELSPHIKLNSVYLQDLIWAMGASTHAVSEDE